MERLISSPVCQLPPKAMKALHKATTEEVLQPGAFTEMGHLPVAAVLGDALQYANQLLEGLAEGASKALMPGTTDLSLVTVPLLPHDAAFLSQVIALQDLAIANGINPDPEVTSGPTMDELVGAARSHLLERYDAWAQEAGRRGETVRIQKGDMDYMYPVAIVKGTSSRLTPGNRPDAFALFVALPLMAPFLVAEEDCFIAPRLE